MATKQATGTRGATAQERADTTQDHKDAKVKPVELDFSAMTVADADDTDFKHEKGSKYDNSPVKEWVAESYKTDTIKQIPVPSKAHADALEQALRAVAARLNVGVKIVTKPAKADQPEGAQVVKFLGKERRAYKPKSKGAEATV